MSARRVIKVGGSLLDLPDLAGRIRGWSDQAPPRQNIYVMGGGRFCNEVRTLHDQHNWTELFSHELCLHLMSVTARVLSQLLEVEVTDTPESFDESPTDFIFDCRRWMDQQKSIPQTWDVTSDSISALLARRLNCELVLLKSTDSMSAVDSFFAKAAEGLKDVKFVNLRKIDQ